MMNAKIATLGMVLILTLGNSAHATESSMKGVKLGFGYDRGLGVTGLFGRLNGFIGNDGIAVDYLFFRQKLAVDSNIPIHWYFGAGGYADWEDDFGARAPVGLEFQFAKNIDAYAQAIPRLRINDHAKFGLGIGFAVRYIF